MHSPPLTAAPPILPEDNLFPAGTTKGVNRKMKKLLSLILAAVMLAACLASCAFAPSASVNARIRTTSDDALDAAAWLTERLGAIPDSVVLGTNADGFGVDVSALEDDGYVFRACGDEVLMFAKTPDGLDRAVRKYAKTVEAGKTVEDAAYHEGYRVNELTIAGNDISEYAIIRATEDDTCVTTAANELSAYIAKSCGALLPVFAASEYEAAGEKPARRIIITSGDESLGDEGFAITVDEAGDLHVDGGIWRGSLFGVYDLLEDDLGWRFIAVPNSYYDGLVPKDRQEFLYEAEHIDITSASDRTEIPSIPVRGGCDDIKQKNTYASLYGPDRGGHGFIIRVCHGLQNEHDNIFKGDYEGVYRGYGEEGHQPCLTDEYVLEAIDAYALEYVQTRLDAGQKIGEDIICVDVATWDGGAFCTCKDCERIRILEGSLCGTVLRMANRVALLLAENYPGVSSGILAYGVTERLPRITKPEPNVYISFTHWPSGDKPRIIPCNNHCVSGKDCGDSIFNNRTFARDLDEWLEVTDPKMMQIWYYPFEDYPNYSSPLFRSMLEDMKYFASKKIEHIYFCMERNYPKNNGLICEGLAEYMGARYMWDADMTEEEGLEYLREWYIILYGKEAGELVFELEMFAERAADLAGCWNSHSSRTRVNYEYAAKHADAVWEKCILASRLADDAAGEALCERYVAGFMNMVLCGCYGDKYVNGTDAERALFAERCGVWRERMNEIYGYVPDDFTLDEAP